MSDFKHRSVRELKQFIRKYNDHFKIKVTGKKKTELVKEINDGMKKTVTDKLKKDYDMLTLKPIKSQPLEKPVDKPKSEAPQRKTRVVKSEPVRSTPPPKPQRKIPKNRRGGIPDIDKEISTLFKTSKKIEDKKQPKKDKAIEEEKIFTKKYLKKIQSFTSDDLKKKSEYDKFLKLKKSFYEDFDKFDELANKEGYIYSDNKGEGVSSLLGYMQMLNKNFEKAQKTSAKPAPKKSAPKKDDAVEGLKSMVKSAKEKEKKTKVDSSIYKDIVDKMKALLKDRNKVAKINELVDDDKSFGKIKSLKNWFDEKFEEYEKLVKELEQLQNKNKNVKMSNDQEMRISGVQDFFESNRFYSK